MSRVAKFLICNSCFWCASALFKPALDAETCPSCGERTVEDVPLTVDESYTFKYSSQNGVVLEFARAQRDRSGRQKF